jgi:biopolymer transport protein ExbD
VKFARRRGEEPEVTLTPLIDIVFLMLIFFMVSTTFLRESAVEIVLPEAREEPVRQPAEVWVLGITERGDYVLDGRLLINNQFETLRQALLAAREDAPDRPLLIRADASARHQSLVTAMDAAGAAGISRLSIATLPREAP